MKEKEGSRKEKVPTIAISFMHHASTRRQPTGQTLWAANQEKRLLAHKRETLFSYASSATSATADAKDDDSVHGFAATSTPTSTTTATTTKGIQEARITSPTNIWTKATKRASEGAALGRPFRAKGKKEEVESAWRSTENERLEECGPRPL